MMQIDAKRAMKFSQVVVFLFDSLQSLTKHELDIIREIIDEGRIVCVVGNKWDLVAKDWKQRAAKYFASQLYSKIDLKALRLMFISAKTGLQVDNVFKEVITLYERWNSRIPTGLLNKWLDAYKKVQNMPSSGAGRLMIRYITQIKVRPPTFYMHVNDRTFMKDNYFKSFSSALTKEFNLDGVTVRILVKDRTSKAITSKKGGFKVKKQGEMFKSTLNNMVGSSRSRSTKPSS